MDSGILRSSEELCLEEKGGKALRGRERDQQAFPVQTGTGLDYCSSQLRLITEVVCLDVGSNN